MGANASVSFFFLSMYRAVLFDLLCSEPPPEASFVHRPQLAAPWFEAVAMACVSYRLRIRFPQAAFWVALSMTSQAIAQINPLSSLAIAVVT
jgi:hypothetical protein